MNLLFNIIIGIILSLLDFYLINFYVKTHMDITKYPKEKSLIFRYFIIFILLIISNCHIKNYLLKLLFNLLSIIININAYRKMTIKDFKFSLLYLMFISIIHFITILLFSYLFNISLLTYYFHYPLPLTFLVLIFNRYLVYIVLLLSKYKSSFNFNLFKTATVFLLVYFCITILMFNKSLFYFPDIGRTFVFVIFISIASLIFFDRYQVKHEKIERDLIITTQNITKEKEYLKKYNDSADEIRKMRHNMHNDLNIIYGYLNSNEFDDAMKHVCHLLGDMNKTSAIIHVGHTSIDSIIDDKIKVMAAKDITYTEEIVSVNIGNIDVNTIAILVGLALDNAIEAAEKVDSGREVKLEIMNRKNYLVLHIENSIIPGSHPTFNKTSKLTDPMNHGYGVKQINHIAKQYNGNAKFEVSHNFVTLKIILDMRLNEDPSL